ncbi:glutamate receptor ionotropic, kainate 2-like [Bolinopsis microptera]|uniref:glutamate receptor ionotropic, kainate 2-like n=1 Tax=Bolinopsis microptera TaxID=2820187 RepID=UPI00307A708F
MINNGLERRRNIALTVVILFFLYTPTSSFPQTLNIGLLTYTELKDEIEAFRYAIDVINENITLLSQTKLTPIIVDMGSIEDSPSNIIRNVLDLVNKEVSAVVGPFRSSHAQIASYIMSELEIPMITPTSTDPFLRNPLWSDFLLHMQPLDEHQSLALLDLAKDMGWNSVALISSMDSYGINGLSTFQKYSNERKIKIVANEMIPLTNDIENIDVSNQMLNLKRSEARIFIMNVHSGYAKVVLRTAAAIGLVGPDYGWVVTDGTIKDAANLLNGTTNTFDGFTQGMIGFMSSMSASSKRDEFLANWHTDSTGVESNGSWAISKWGTETKSLQLQSRASLTYDSVWVIAHALDHVIYQSNLKVLPPDVDYWSTPVRSFKNGTMIKNSMLKLQKFEGLTGEIQFDPQGGPVKKMYDLVNFRSKDVVKVGGWTKETGLVMIANETIVWNGQSEEIPTSAVRSLKGTRLRLGITQEPPFIMIDMNCTAKDPKNKDCYSGLCIELVELLASILEFDYDYVLSEDNKFGSPEANGTWNGLIKMLLEGKIDVGAVNFAMNKARESAIDFTMPFINTGLVMTTKIKESKSDPFFWTKPFDIDLWYAILAFALLMVLLIWLYDHMSPFGFYGRRMHAALRCSCKSCEAFRCNKEPSGSDEEDECLFETRLCDPSENNEELMNVGNSLWMIAACLFSIGPVEGVPRNMSGRVILAMWWFMILIVTAMYTANLAAFLTVTRMENGINSIVDLISQDKVKWGTVNGTNAQILLQAAKAPDLVEVYKKMQTVNSVEEGFEKARNEEYIFFYGGAIVAFEANTQPCNLQIIGERLFSFGYAFGFPPQSPYLETFNSALLNLSGRNELDALWKKWSKGDCAQKGKKSSSSSLNLANIYGLCYTFFVVIAVSGVILIGEILYESIMDVKRFKTTFLNALKYRLVYIWKRPEYQILKDNDGGSKSPKSEERGDITSYLPSAVECDAKPKSIKSEDLSFQFLPISIGHGQKQRHPDTNVPSIQDQEKLIPVPGHEYRPNGFSVSQKSSSMDRQPSLKEALLKQQAMLNDPLLNTKEPHISYVSNKLHPYHSLPLTFSSPADSDNSKTGSMPRSVHKYRGRHPKHSSRSPSVKNDHPQHRYEDLFDRTLERMTSHSHTNGDGASERSSKAKRTAPLLKGASLSTRSPSPMYSSQENVMSDTDELRTESDVSPPP